MLASEEVGMSARHSGRRQGALGHRLGKQYKLEKAEHKDELKAGVVSSYVRFLSEINQKGVSMELTFPLARARLRVAENRLSR